MGCNAHPHVRTPHLDALAARGTLFENAYTPSPICVSARASLATGRWVHQTGCWSSAEPYRGAPPGWAHHLRRAGHEVVSIGKLHYRSSRDDNGFSEEILPLHVVDGVGWVQGLLRRDPLPFADAADLAGDVGAGESDYTRYDRKVCAAACEWLHTHAADARLPWVLQVSFVAPHYPLTAPEEYFDRYRSVDPAVPEIAADDTAIAHPAVAALADFFNYHDYFDAARAADARRAYFGLCSFLDGNVGRVLQALTDSGCRDSTRVLYTSDHGEMLGNHGLWAKSFMFEDAVRVPLIFAGPGVPVGRRLPTLANLVDVYPTAIEALGADMHESAHPAVGVSLFELAAGRHARRVTFSEYHDGGSRAGSFMLRDGRWKFVYHVGHGPQLFDLHEDPDERNDLGRSQRHDEVRRCCERKLREIVDPEHVDARAFADQARLVDHYGGREGIQRRRTFNYTPVPDSFER